MPASAKTGNSFIKLYLLRGGPCNCIYGGYNDPLSHPLLQETATQLFNSSLKSKKVLLSDLFFDLSVDVYYTTKRTKICINQSKNLLISKLYD